MLEARLLGRFEVSVEGVPVQIPSRPAQSLFAYVLLNPGVPHRREKLAGLLWPESAEESARSNLRHALWRVRRSLEAAGSAESLMANDLSVTFDSRSPHRTDVEVLQAERRAGETTDMLRERVSVYGGELLPGFHDDWVILERERLKGIFERVVQEFIDQLVREERWAEVKEWGEHWIAVGNSPEPAFRALMTAAAAVGDVASVASTYRRCVSALKADLGVEPSQQTRLLYDRLVKGESPVRTSERAIVDPTQPRLGHTGAPSPGSSPYKGLRHYDESDATRFFGREELVGRIVVRVRASRFVAIVGASGSGKSSLLRAGVLPALFTSEGARQSRVYVLTPTARPLESLAIALARGANTPATSTSLVDSLSRGDRGLRLMLAASAGPQVDSYVVVDQFEELFTECRDENERQIFIENLISSTGPEGAVAIIVTLRADFYDRCARYARLRDLLAAQQEYIGPMTAEELRRAIVEPARQGGWDFEHGLVDVIVRDVGNEPDALPLLSHALLETWERRSERTMTLRGYAESGGVHGAIARTAETVFNQRLDAGERNVAKAIFLRLAAFGETTQSTRRRVPIADLPQGAAERSTVERVLRVLADARLVSIGVESVEVAHEALFREWPALRQWLNEDRDGLRVHRHLSMSAGEWDETGREEAELYRGTRLGQAVEWSATRSGQLSALEREFLDASAGAVARERADRERHQRKELEEARRRTFMLSGAFVVALVLAVVAIFFGEQARSSALATQLLARASLSRELAAASVSQLATDPERSTLLALQAVAATYPVDGPPTPESEAALHRAVGASHLELRLSGHTDAIIGVAFSPDAKRVLTASADGTARVWDATSGAVLMTLRHSTAAVNSAVFSPDGRLIATASDDGTAKLWDARTAAELRTLSGHRDNVSSVVFSPDGTTLVTSSIDGTARLWDAASGRTLLTLSGHGGGIRMVAFAPDGQHIATASLDRTARVWDVASGKEIVVLRGHSGGVNGVAFSPDGTRIATTSSDATVRLWDEATGRELLTFTGHANITQGVAFSPDGTRILTASYSGDVKIWDPASGKITQDLKGHPNSVYGVAFSPGGRRVASGGVDRVARLWNAGPDRELLTVVADRASLMGVVFDSEGSRFASGGSDGVARVWDARSGEELVRLVGHRDAVYRVAWSKDGARLATASRDNTAKIWDARSGRELLTLSGHGPPTVQESFAGILSVAFSPDGTRVVTAGTDGTARIWDAASGKQILVIAGRSRRLNDVSFDPDGKRIVTAGDDDDTNARLWDAASGELVRTFAGHVDRVWGAAFSPDGHRLATSSTDATVRVWDVATGEQLLVIPAHSGTVLSVVYSRDGSRLATAGVDGYARIWNATNGTPVLETGDGLLPLSGVALSGDSSVLAAASRNAGIHLYLTRIDDLVALARSRLTRSLTQTECATFLHRPNCP